MALTPFNWECPHCGHPQTVTDPQYSTGHTHFYHDVKHDYGNIGGDLTAIICANPICRGLTLTVSFGRDDVVQSNWKTVRASVTRRLIPESSAKPQPSYIPNALREDYIEACRIRDLSPKAAATLIRRCLQGMIRDFCGIAKSRLIDEIAELQTLIATGKAPAGVSVESVEAIDHVRQVGNIGAHMEKDISLIVPVDPDEAQLLIDLVELLFDEWYVARHKREEQLKAIKALAAAKQAAKVPSAALSVAAAPAPAAKP